MIVLTPLQRELLKYIKARRYRSVRLAGKDLRYSPKSIQFNVQVLKRAKLVKQGATLVAV